MNFKELFKHRPFQIAYCIFSLLLCAYCIHGFVDLTRQSHTRYIERDMAAAVDKLQKSPPGIERAEAFLKRLKAIDPGYAPAEVKQALHDYIAVTEQAINAMKSGEDFSHYNAAMAEAKERLTESIKKYH